MSVRRTGVGTVAEIAHNPHVAFVVSDTDVPRTLQIEGVVEDLTETETTSPRLTQFVRFLAAQKPYGIPLEHFDDASMKWYRLTPQWIRWGDFTFARGADAVFSQVDADDTHSA